MYPSSLAQVTPLTAVQRGMILDCSRRTNRNHVRQGVEKLGSGEACGPYCLFLVSLERQGFSKVSIATRLEDDDPGHYNLDDLLEDIRLVALANRTETRRAGRLWDPRSPQAGIVLQAEEVGDNAELVGVGVSMLDLPGQPWEKAKQSWAKVPASDRAMESGCVGGLVKILLTDGTAISCFRSERGPDEIVSTYPIDSAFGRQVMLDPNLITHDAEREAWSRKAAHGASPQRHTWEGFRLLLDILAKS